MKNFDVKNQKPKFGQILTLKTESFDKFWRNNQNFDK